MQRQHRRVSFAHGPFARDDLSLANLFMAVRLRSNG